MVTRWEITKAVRASDLSASSRLIMFTLADVAEVGTAEIPAKFTPSLTVLAAETGLDKSTVKRHLGALEAAGWLVRNRPSAKAQWEGERTRYRLTLPRGITPPVGAEIPQGEGTVPPGVGAQEAEGGRTVRHLETDHSDQGQISSDRPSSPTQDLAIPDRSDVEQVCRYLADRIEENGSKRPAITKAWRDAARRLIDKDGRSVEQVIRAIDWCQEDDFWRSNVLSMPKLREQYDRLRLAAQRNGSRNGTKLATTDQRVAAAQALKAKFGGRS